MSTGRWNAPCTHAAASSVAPIALLSRLPASLPRTHPARPIGAWVIQLELLGRRSEPLDAELLRERLRPRGDPRPELRRLHEHRIAPPREDLALEPLVVAV